MDTRYIYSANRIKAMEASLLSDAQVERLLSARDRTQAFQVLSDTFLSPYVSTEGKTKLPEALRASLIDTKKELSSIAPAPELLNVLWFRYDFYNLKTIIKAMRAGLAGDEILDRCYDIGSIPARVLLDTVLEERTSSLYTELYDAYKTAIEAEEVYKIDIVMNKGYFKAVKRVAENTKNTFLKRFVTLLIDLFNIKTALRVSVLPDIGESMFIAGGSIGEEALDGEDNILNSLSSIGSESMWKDAVEQYRNNGHYALLEKTADDYTLDFLKDESRDMFSIATLFAFFAARRNNAQIVKAAITAKETGMKEAELRIILRKLYS